MSKRMPAAGARRRKTWAVIVLLVVAAATAYTWSKVAEWRFRGTLEAAAASAYDVSQSFHDQPDWWGFPKWGSQSRPDRNEYRCVRDMFACAVTSGLWVVNWDFFWASGLPRPGASLESFTSSNNAWRFVADVTETYSDECPIMWSRNLVIRSVDERLNRDAEDLPEQLQDIPPFGRRGFVFVTYGCRVHILTGADLRFDAFTNRFNFISRYGSSAPIFTNRVLDP